MAEKKSPWSSLSLGLLPPTLSYYTFGRAASNGLLFFPPSLSSTYTVKVSGESVNAN